MIDFSVGENTRKIQVSTIYLSVPKVGDQNVLGYFKSHSRRDL